MSKTGKNPVAIPQGTTVDLQGNTVNVKGKLGEMKLTLSDKVILSIQDNAVVVRPIDDTKESRTMWGTARSLIQNVVKGVTTGFQIDLEIQGVGYRAALQGKDLVLQLGFSHEVRVTPPEGVTIKVETPTKLSVSGRDKQSVGSVASYIRSFKPPEPYKGKGIRYAGEIVLRKEGKKK